MCLCFKRWFVLCFQTLRLNHLSGFVFTGKAVDMSFDHKPTDHVELHRIIKAGGQVGADSRVNGGLNLSRAIGENILKSLHCVICANNKTSQETIFTRETRPCH